VLHHGQGLSIMAALPFHHGQDLSIKAGHGKAGP
jgi:hypothetical protein